MGSPTKKTKNNKPINRIKRNNEQQSYSGKRLLSDVHTNVNAAIEKNNNCRILASCTRIDNYGAFTDNAFGKTRVDVWGGGRGTFRPSFDAPFYRLIRSMFCSSTLSCVLQSFLFFKHLRIFVISPRKSLWSPPQRSIFRKARPEHRLCRTEL